MLNVKGKNSIVREVKMLPNAEQRRCFLTALSYKSSRDQIDRSLFICYLILLKILHTIQGRFPTSNLLMHRIRNADNGSITPWILVFSRMWTFRLTLTSGHTAYKGYNVTVWCKVCHVVTSSNGSSFVVGPQILYSNIKRGYLWSYYYAHHLILSVQGTL